MSLDAMIPWIAEYTAGKGEGAAKLFTSRHDLLEWTRGEIKRLQDIPMRGSPPLPDHVSVMHRLALQKMIAEYDLQKRR